MHVDLEFKTADPKASQQQLLRDKGSMSGLDGPPIKVVRNREPDGLFKLETIDNEDDHKDKF